MGIAWNTRQLLAAPLASFAAERVSVEYHFQSWRELYDKTILSADRHHSSAGEWVVRAEGHFYNVAVVSRPVYALPQELCLAFDCHTLVEEGVTAGGSYRSEGPPIEEVARDFIALLSVWAREPLVPLGIRRQHNRAITQAPLYALPRRDHRRINLHACGIDGKAFTSVLRGIASTPDARAAAILGATRFYHAALSQVGFDPSGAYVALVSAIECLAGHLHSSKRFDFSSVEKFKGVRTLLAEVAKCEATKELCPLLEAEMLRSEHFVWQKFLLFITEHLSDDFWETPDEIYSHTIAFPPISRKHLRWCLRRIYDARSEYVHGGTPFPAYTDFGMREWCSRAATFEIMQLIGQERYLPPFSWFERLTHLVIVEFMLRAFAPDFAQARVDVATEKKRLLGVMEALPPNVQEGLRKLTRWTAQFVGFSVVGPHAPNEVWADGAEIVEALVGAGLIVCSERGTAGSAMLRNREIGEAAGEFVFGSEANPMRGNEILFPRGYESLFEPKEKDGMDESSNSTDES